MGATLQIDVDYDDLTAQELLEDLTLAIHYWLHLASCHYGYAVEQTAGSLLEDVLRHSPGSQFLLPAYREAKILTTKYIIKGEPVLMLMSYAVPPETMEGKASCHIAPAKKVRDKADILARKYKIEEGRVEDIRDWT
jgi:hypothetical protein